MTQEEFVAANKSGAVSFETPESDTHEAGGLPASTGMSLSQFLPLLIQLQSVQQFVSTPPTNIPQTFQDQFQFVYDGANYFLYLYFNNK